MEEICRYGGEVLVPQVCRDEAGEATEGWEWAMEGISLQCYVLKAGERV